MSLKVVRYVNDLMSSNCYLVIDEMSGHCLCIDPASEKSIQEISLIETYGLVLDYILLTHEHTDHTWGVNALKRQYPTAQLVCSESCAKYAPKASRAYFLLYYDRPDYSYTLVPADIIISSENDSIEWFGYHVSFFLTPGHSYGSMCIDIDGTLFTGDTIMPFKPYFNGRDSNEEEWKRSILKINRNYSKDTVIYPGHGDLFLLKDWKEYNYCDND